MKQLSPCPGNHFHVIPVLHIFFQERSFLCAAISSELAVSTIFYISRILILPGLHPDLVLVVCFIRVQLTATLTLLLVFVPKFWYQQKQVRSLAQEYSCRIPVDAFKVCNFILLLLLQKQLPHTMQTTCWAKCPKNGGATKRGAPIDMQIRLSYYCKSNDSSF